MVKKKELQKAKPTSDSQTKEISVKTSEKPAETEQELKKKIESLVDIIEELSSNVDKKGLPEVESLLENKIKDLNEKFEFKLQELKNTLDSIEKKSGRSKTKEEISALIDEFKKTLEPRFSTIEEKLSLLDKLETAKEAAPEKEDEAKKQLIEQNAQFSKLALPTDIDQIRRAIIQLNDSLTSINDQVIAMKDAVKAGGLMDAQDVQKLENVLSSLDQMIPQKIVIENFKKATSQMDDLKKKMDEFNADMKRLFDCSIDDFNKRIERNDEIQSERFNNISSRLETLVKYVNSFVEERDKIYEELNKLKSDMNFRFDALTKSQDHKNIFDSLSSLKSDINARFNNFEKNPDHKNILEELNRIKSEINSRFNLLEKNQDHEKIQREIEDLSNAIDGLAVQVALIKELKNSLKELASNQNLKALEDNLDKDIKEFLLKRERLALNELEKTLATKIWVKNILMEERKEMIKIIDDRFSKLQKYIQQDLQKRVEEIDNLLMSERKEMERKSEENRRALISIFRELRK